MSIGVQTTINTVLLALIAILPTLLAVYLSHRALTTKVTSVKAIVNGTATAQDQKITNLEAKVSDLYERLVVGGSHGTTESTGSGSGTTTGDTTVRP